MTVERAVGRHVAQLGFASRAIHHGFEPAAFRNAVRTPVFLTSTYGFESVEDDLRQALAVLG